MMWNWVGEIYLKIKLVWGRKCELTVVERKFIEKKNGLNSRKRSTAVRWWKKIIKTKLGISRLALILFGYCLLEKCKYVESIKASKEI